MIEERVVKATGEEISTYRYDDINQLVEATNPQGTTAFTYYPSGLRETKTHGGEVTKFYYDGQNVILEETNNSLRARNIYGNGAGPAVRENYDAAGNANNYFYLYNGHGDVVSLLDENCNIINDYEYDIYGETLQLDGIIVDNPFRYAGQYYDKETDLYYLRARYYDPELMRFITEDTNKGDVKDPLSLNLYTYCVGNPVKLMDADGHMPWIVIGALIGGVVNSGIDIITQVANGKDISTIDWGSVGISFCSGAVSGALTASGAGLIAQVAGNMVISGIDTAVKDFKNDGNIDNWDKVFKSALIGGAAGLAGGPGAQEGTKIVAFNIKAIGKFGYITVDKFQSMFIQRLIGKELIKGLIKGSGTSIILNNMEEYKKLLELLEKLKNDEKDIAK